MVPAVTSGTMCAIGHFCREFVIGRDGTAPAPARLMSGAYGWRRIVKHRAFPVLAAVVSFVLAAAVAFALPA